MMRQPLPSSPPASMVITAALPMASIEPSGSPICIRAPPLPRCAGDQVSATRAAPQVQAPPMPSPARKRSTSIQRTDGAKAVRPEKTAYSNTQTIRPRTRPIRSASQPNTMPPTMRPAARMLPIQPACAFVMANVTTKAGMVSDSMNVS